MRSCCVFDSLRLPLSSLCCLPSLLSSCLSSWPSTSSSTMWWTNSTLAEYDPLAEWLQDFKENLVDKNVCPYQHSRSSSHELPTEPRAKVVPDSGKHNVYTHFPKDRNCEICLWTKITRASCRRNTGTVVPKAEELVI